MEKAARPKKPRSVSAPESHLGYRLRCVSNRVPHAFSLKVQARGVTAAGWVVLRELYDREDMLSALAGKGLITRKASDGDRRSQTLALTAEGGALVPGLGALADENNEAFFGQLDRSTRKTIEAAMREIVRREGLRNMPVD